MSFMPTAWNKTTGIQARRVADFKDLSHEEWVEKRKDGIGGSDISAIAGVNHFKSAIDVYLEKKGKKVTQENEKMKWGKLLEDPVAQEYSQSIGVQVNRVNAILQHPEIPHFQANIDRLIVRNGHDLSSSDPVHQNLLNNGNGILEVKTTGWAKAWANNSIPDMYYCQLQWYLYITGLKWGHFAVLVSGQDFLTTDLVPYDPKVGKNLAFIADRFWQENIVKDVIPDVDHNPANYESVKLLFPNVDAKTVNLPEDLNDLIAKRILLNKNIGFANDQKKVIDAKVLRALESNKYGFTSKYKVTRVLKSHMSLSKSAIKEKYPKIYAECSSASESVYPLYSEIKS